MCQTCDETFSKSPSTFFIGEVSVEEEMIGMIPVRRCIFCGDIWIHICFRWAKFIRGGGKRKKLTRKIISATVSG